MGCGVALDALTREFLPGVWDSGGRCDDVGVAPDTFVRTAGVDVGVAARLDVAFAFADDTGGACGCC